MRSFQHITPPLRLFSGPDSLQFLGRELERLDSRRAVVFCGPWAEGPMLDAVRVGHGRPLRRRLRRRRRAQSGRFRAGSRRTS